MQRRWCSTDLTANYGQSSPPRAIGIILFSANNTPRVSTGRPGANGAPGVVGRLIEENSWNSIAPVIMTPFLRRLVSHSAIVHVTVINDGSDAVHEIEARSMEVTLWKCLIVTSDVTGYTEEVSKARCSSPPRLTPQSAAHGSSNTYDLTTRNPLSFSLSLYPLPPHFSVCECVRSLFPLAIDLQTRIKLTYALELSRWPADDERGMSLCRDREVSAKLLTGLRAGGGRCA